MKTQRDLTYTLCSLLITVLVFGFQGHGQQDDQQRTGRSLGEAVALELELDESVPGQYIDVRARNGVVTLTGWVNNLLAKDRAGRAARTVKGVRAVKNQIKVRTATRSDTMLRSRVFTTLTTDPATERYEVDLDVDNGTVSLRGTVDSMAEKRLIGRVVKGVRGVRDVDNDLTVEVEADRPDSAISEEVRNRLQASVWVDSALIDVRVNDGSVTLSGTVPDAAAKERAESLAWVAGVSDVSAENLQVEPWAEKEFRRDETDTETVDRTIKDAVQRSLSYNPRTAPFSIEASVADRDVTLRGEVGTLMAKQTAEEIARNVNGVQRVRNKLKVRPDEFVDDAELEDRAVSMLQDDPYVSPHNVRVTASNGRVFLSGSVPSYYIKTRAEKTVSKVKGVANVQNALDVQEEWDAKTDVNIKEDVREQLRNSAYLTADDITVEVENGVVTLTGSVESWRAKTVARDNAYEGGAKTVRNELTVKNAPEGGQGGEYKGPFEGRSYYGPGQNQ